MPAFQQVTGRERNSLRRCESLDRPRPVMLHVLLLIALCCLPALVLLPLRILDREPPNEITHEQEDRPRRDPDAELAVAA